MLDYSTVDGVFELRSAAGRGGFGDDGFEHGVLQGYIVRKKALGVAKRRCKYNYRRVPLLSFCVLVELGAS